MEFFSDVCAIVKRIGRTHQHYYERFYCNAETEVRILCGILSSRHDHAKGARPRKRGGDVPGRGRACSHAGGLAARSVNSSRLPRVATVRFATNRH